MRWNGLSCFTPFHQLFANSNNEITLFTTSFYSIPSYTINPNEYLWMCDVVWCGVKWTRVVNNKISLFKFTNNKWSGMEHDEIYSIKSFIFCSIRFGVDAMEWDIFNKILKQWSEIYISFCSAPFHSDMFHSALLRLVLLCSINLNIALGFVN